MVLISKVGSGGFKQDRGQTCQCPVGSARGRARSNHELLLFEHPALSRVTLKDSEEFSAVFVVLIFLLDFALQYTISVCGDCTSILLDLSAVLRTVRYYSEKVVNC